MFPNGACLPFLNSIPSAVGTMFCANKTHSTDQLFSKGTCPFVLALSPGPGSPPGIGYSSLSIAVLPLGPGVARVHRTTHCCPPLQITLQHCKRFWLSRSNNTDNECFPGQYALCILFLPGISSSSLASNCITHLPLAVLSIHCTLLAKPLNLALSAAPAAECGHRRAHGLDKPT